MSDKIYVFHYLTRQKNNKKKKQQILKPATTIADMIMANKLIK